MKKTTKLTEDDRRFMIEALLVFGGKSEEYYEKCTDEQLSQEYDKHSIG